MVVETSSAFLQSEANQLYLRLGVMTFNDTIIDHDITLPRKSTLS